MGLAPDDPVRHKLRLDYDAPVEELYSQYFKEACDQDRHFFLLCLAGLSFRSTLALPTFVPDWTRAGKASAYPLFGKHSLGNPGLHPADLHFEVELMVEWSASGTVKADSKYSNDGQVLAVTGIHVDAIKTMGAVATEIGKEESTEDVREALHDWGTIMLKTFGSKEIRVDERETPVTIRDVADRWCEIISSKILTEEEALNLKAIEKAITDISMEDEKDVPSCGDYIYPPTGESVLEAYVRTLITNRVSAFETAGGEFGDWFWNHEVKPWNAAAGELDPYCAKLTRARAIQRGRRLFVTETGLLGLCPAETQAGDFVCVVYGCPVPLVLRPRGDGHLLVGECYTHGLMTGRAVELLKERHRDGKETKFWEEGPVLTEREFILH